MEGSVKTWNKSRIMVLLRRLRNFKNLEAIRKKMKIYELIGSTQRTNRKLNQK